MGKSLLSKREQFVLKPSAFAGPKVDLCDCMLGESIKHGAGESIRGHITKGSAGPVKKIIIYPLCYEESLKHFRKGKCNQVYSFLYLKIAISNVWEIDCRNKNGFKKTNKETAAIIYAVLVYVNNNLE